MRRPFGQRCEAFCSETLMSFGRLGDAAESLDDFRYTKAWFLLRVIWTRYRIGRNQLGNDRRGQSDR